MIELDVLRIADFYAWLGCQKTTAQRLGCNQSTVSRRAREISRLGASLRSENQPDFLHLERRLHQCWRFRSGRDLRVHSYRWINPPLHRHLPTSWCSNPAVVSVTRTAPLELLGAHVIDALLAPAPVVADLDRSRFALVPLYLTPLLLLAPAGSTLSRETGLSDGDIATASRLGALDFVPATAAACSRHLDEQLFAAPRSVEVDPDPRPEAEQRLDCRYWGTSLTPLVRPTLVVLDYQTPVSYSEFLVCRREWREHAEMLRLLEAVRQALAVLPLDGEQRSRLAVA